MIRGNRIEYQEINIEIMVKLLKFWIRKNLVETSLYRNVLFLNEEILILSLSNNAWNIFPNFYLYRRNRMEKHIFSFKLVSNSRC